MAKYYEYTPSKAGLPKGRTLHRNTDLKAIVDPSAVVSTNPGAALWEISETTNSKGLRPRSVELVRIDGDSGTIKGIIRVAIATEARWNEITDSDSFVVDGKQYKLRRKIAEEYGV
jgi:hypothetical protein